MIVVGGVFQFAVFAACIAAPFVIDVLRDDDEHGGSDRRDDDWR